MAQPTLSLVVNGSRSPRVRELVIALLAVFVLSGCSTLNRNASCALVGAGVGATAGVIYGVNESNFNSVETGAVTVGGAAAGALIGYGVCAIADLVQ